MCDITHMNECCMISHIWTHSWVQTHDWCSFAWYGWLRLVSSIKLQVSIAKEPYKRDYILPKRPIIWRSILNAFMSIHSWISVTFVRDRSRDAELYEAAIQVCDMTHSYVWRYSLLYATKAGRLSCMRVPSKCATWRIHMCDMTHSYVWHDSVICVTEVGRQSCMSVLFKSSATQCFCPTPAFVNFAKRCVYISVRVYTWLSCMSVLLKLSATQCFCSTPALVNFAPRCVYIYARVCTYPAIWVKRYSVFVPDASVRKLCGKVHYIYMYMCVHIQLSESSATSCFCLTPAFVDFAERCTIYLYVCVHIQFFGSSATLFFCWTLVCTNIAKRYIMHVYVCVCIYVCVYIYACACALFLCRTPVCANFANNYIMHIYLCVYMHMYTYMCLCVCEYSVLLPNARVHAFCESTNM